MKQKRDKFTVSLLNVYPKMVNIYAMERQIHRFCVTFYIFLICIHNTFKKKKKKQKLREIED